MLQVRPGRLELARVILVVHASYAGALVAPWLSLHSDLPRFEYTGPIE